MSVSFNTFDRLKSKGLEAYQSGEYLAAKAYLVDAADGGIELVGRIRRPIALWRRVPAGRIENSPAIDRWVLMAQAKVKSRRDG
jgi:hypothetical protein